MRCDVGDKLEVYCSSSKAWQLDTVARVSMEDPKDELQDVIELQTRGEEWADHEPHRHSYYIRPHQGIAHNAQKAYVTTVSMKDLDDKDDETSETSNAMSDVIDMQQFNMHKSSVFI